MDQQDQAAEDGWGSEETLKSSEAAMVPEAEDSRKFPTGWRQVVFFLCFASFYFGNATALSSIVTIVWPNQIQNLVGVDKKEEYNGIIPAFGAVVSLVVTPIAGMLSDYTTHRFRRRLYLLTGTIIGAVFLGLAGLFRNGANVWLFMACTLGIQFGMAFAAGPYAGLLPDLVPQKFVGTASGYLALALVFGDLVGVLLAGFLVSNGVYWIIYLVLLLIAVVFMIPTVVTMHERPVAAKPHELTLKRMFQNLYLDPKIYRDFYWIIITRFCEQMGVYTILPYIQYFLEDIIKVANPTFESSIMIALIVIFAMPSGLLAGYLSDKINRKILVYIASIIMAVVVCMLIVVSFNPSLAASFTLAGVMGVGYGAYQAVDWALALDVLPAGANVAKDLGIWHIAMILPQVIAPLITGFVLDAFKPDRLKQGYTIVFSMAAAWFVLATILIYPVRLRSNLIQPTENKLKD